MSNAPVGNAAIQSTKGTIYQLYLALHKCFEMTVGQSVFIERFGDVTLSNSQQIEVKQYADNLTDSHLNLWKTIANWMRPEFDEKKYVTLILFTTQLIGPDSKLSEWNAGDTSRRLAILHEILQEAEKRHSTRVAAHDTTKPALTIPDILQIQRRVLQSPNAPKLREVVSRMFISSGSPDLSGLYNRMKQIFCKGVLVGKQDDMCAAMLGYVVSPPAVEQQGWEISYDAFAAKCTDLNSQFCKETKRFPTKYRRPHDSPAPSTPAQRFMQNIHDINYAEAVPKAVKDYLYASDTVAKDFAAYERPPENYQIFSDEVLNQFHPHQSIAKRTLASQPEGEKTFYDQMMIMPAPGFPGFETPNTSFRNGVLHMHHDDETRKLSWKLT